MHTRSAVAARWLLGIAFVVFGADGFLHVLPIPAARPPAERFIAAVIETGYLFPMVKCIEIAAGLLLLANRRVPLALVLLAPLLVVIGSLHVALNPPGIPLVVILVGLHGFLVARHWPSFRPLVAPTAR